ncbi:hypothetical protein QJS10_CPB13g00253 [Acorus calamus]|uniref:Legume lectin domain-containing protein n=1 Tax=Acorus calamus TaxID=4465 RepID=A0AAV9DF42_ACOCL|nr:hypothetical protein QJS10_CPB13g00253 [Acorus calamus]
MEPSHARPLQLHHPHHFPDHQHQRVSDQLSADGFVFFLSPNGSAIPNDTCGGCLGMVGFNNTNFQPADKSSIPFVGVEFDTFLNEGDPHDFPNHIGIDVDSVKSIAVNGRITCSIEGR